MCTCINEPTENNITLWIDSPQYEIKLNLKIKSTKNNFNFYLILQCSIMNTTPNVPFYPCYDLSFRVWSRTKNKLIILMKKIRYVELFKNLLQDKGKNGTMW